MYGASSSRYAESGVAHTRPSQGFSPAASDAVTPTEGKPVVSGGPFELVDLVGLDTRLSVTFSPTMTLELYAQPFFASGHYYSFEEYAALRTSALRVYGRDMGTISSTRAADGTPILQALAADTRLASGPEARAVCRLILVGAAR